MLRGKRTIISAMLWAISTTVLYLLEAPPEALMGTSGLGLVLVVLFRAMAQGGVRGYVPSKRAKVAGLPPVKGSRGGKAIGILLAVSVLLGSGCAGPLQTSTAALVGPGVVAAMQSMQCGETPQVTVEIAEPITYEQALQMMAGMLTGVVGGAPAKLEKVLLQVGIKACGAWVEAAVTVAFTGGREVE